MGAAEDANGSGKVRALLLRRLRGGLLGRLLLRRSLLSGRLLLSCRRLLPGGLLLGRCGPRRGRPRNGCGVHPLLDDALAAILRSRQEENIRDKAKSDEYGGENRRRLTQEI